MDMKISGAGMIGGGEYEEIRISGSAVIEGAVRCRRFSCSGSVKGGGELFCEEDAVVSGSAKIDGAVRGKTVRVSGSVSCGSLTGEESVRISGGARIDGGLKGGEVSVSGGLRLGAGIEAERFELSGATECPGLLNAETVEIRLSRDPSAIQAIGGSRVTVEQGVFSGGKSLLAAFFNRRGAGGGTLSVRESIEADDVSLVNTSCPVVTGARVVIGGGCKIGVVRYAETLEADPAAEIGRTEKI